VLRVAAYTAAAFVCVCLSGAVEAQPAACQRLDGTSLRDVHWQHNQPRHPLAGQVFKGDRPIAIASDTCTRTPLQQLIVEVWDVVRAGGIVLLGEVHDNPEHHAVRGQILRPGLDKLRATEDAHPAAVFEHIRTPQQAQLDNFHAKAAASRRLWSAPDLLNELGWKDSGWPPAEIFVPLFDAVLRAKMPIVPGSAQRDRLRMLARGDLSSATPEEKARLEIAGAMPQPLLEALTAELSQSHCGVMPASAFGAMSLAQRYTDAHLADALVKAAARHGGAFLLAGNGHVRTDRGVAWFVRRMAPQVQVAAVTLAEVEEGAADPETYLPRSPEGGVATDYTLFTPRHDRPDPCAKMREQYQPRKQ
jgi:uncharacterized iron-regulated protein